MPHDYVALGMAFLEAVNSRDTDRVLELVDPEVRFEPLRAGTEGAYIGHEGMRRYLDDTRENFEFAEATVTETFAIEHGVVGIGTFASGAREAELRWRFRQPSSRAIATAC
jgi:hypothetical protein